MKALVLLFGLSFLFTSFIDPPCSIMKKGKFKYLDADDKTAFFEIDGNKEVEYYQNKKYYVKSDLKWTSDCTYELTMTAATKPNLAFKPGDKLKVEIVKVSNDTVTYKGITDKRVWLGKLKVIK
jgi:hypothetical protein